MHDAVAATRPRCLTVAAAATEALWGVAAVLLRSAAGAAPTDPVVGLCLAALAVVAVVAWGQLLAGVTDAWRGATPRGGSTLRRLALVACGAAVVAAATGGAARADPLDGLPLPDRAEGHAAGHAARHHRPQGTEVVVRRGDTLWHLAERDLGNHPTAAQVTERWHQVYAANRAVIGPDPDLLRPGQRLRLEHPTNRHHSKEKP